MKLIYIADARIPTEKANGIQIMNMCSAFSSVGVEVELIAPNRKNNIPDDPFSYYNLQPNFKITKLWDVDLTRFGKVGFWVQSSIFAALVLVYCILIVRDPDAVFYSRHSLPLLFLKTKKNPRVWEVHAPTHPFIARLLKDCTLIVTISQGLKDLYVSLGMPADKVVVEHDGINPDSFFHKNKRVLRTKMKIPQEELLVSYIGKYKTMGEPKGVGSMVASFSLIHNEISRAKLLFVGLGELDKREIELLANERNVPLEKIYLIDHVPHAEAIEYVCLSDILVAPYPHTEHYAKYMSPLKIFEYMASGNAIIASDLPSLREVLDDDSAVFINPDSIEEMAEAIKKLATSPVKRQSIGKVAREKVKNYTWIKRAERIIEKIKSE